MAETCALCWTEHEYDSACPVVLTETNELNSKAFPAQYPAGCAICNGHIAEGELVGYAYIDPLGHDALIHERCPA